ncbi:hypothetical protein JZO66_13070 [Enterococcus sp. DIV0242_7C1]|uniref:Uncharacterized protein n=1 Tax=Candidatus Enterococcus dunnyi TaxID=1834192 RepID=A0A200J634_9ENTE|nr:hypothetical protein [Enterococcus sp. DIV0242_7C1]OUZ32644.1 hypothetical protein A5889_001353 [Enterococcus sp. 9D6_DIV0238]
MFTGKELSTGDRILRGLSGLADLALAGYGTYKGLKLLKGTNKVVASREGSSYKIPDIEITNPLSKRNIKHIQTRHNVNSIKSQADYLSDTQLAEKLKDQSFFNSRWTTNEITNYSEIAYNDLLKQGKKGGLFEYVINGEKLNVYIHNDGTFGSVYGNYQYSVQDIRNMMK